MNHGQFLIDHPEDVAGRIKSMTLLEKELKVERLKTEAANAIIDVAEENLGIDLRKKTGAKQ